MSSSFSRLKGELHLKLVFYLLYVVDVNLIGNENNFEDDYVVKSMGASGRWQTIVCILVGLNKLSAIWNIHSILFLTAATEYKCIKFKDNVTIDVKNSTCYKNCEEYEFYQDVFEETLISEFGLICEKEWMASFTQTVLMLGLTLGVSLFGWISDRFGRRNALILSCILDSTFMLAAAYARNYWTLAVLRFFIGLASGGAMSISAVFTIEIVGPQHRELAVGLALLPDGIGECMIALFAYFSPTWNIYLLSISVASIAIVILLLFMPETPRWLITNGKADRAVKLMTKAAKFNNRSVDGIRDIVTKSLQELNVKENESQNLQYTDLFQTRKLSLITVSCFTMWFVSGLCYFGLNQYNTVLGSNVFMVVAIMGAIQIPLAMITSVTTKVFGRKASTVGTYVICAASMICFLFAPVNTWLTTLFGVIGVSSAFLSFCVLYIYTTELYPTPMRNMGFSSGSTGSKLGATIAPLVVSLKPQWVVPTIFAVLSVTASGVCLLLPETKGQKLRDAVEKETTT